MALSQIPPKRPMVVAVFAGDSVLSQALEVWLGTAGYDVRLLEASLTRDLSGMLDEVHLVLLGPRLRAELREALLGSMGSVPEMAALPVLELTTAGNEARDERVARVPWPCRAEDLEREIEAALLSRKPKMQIRPERGVTDEI
jgi:hypothetical protein